ncbi:MAG: transglycosylase SLT domain-containing protein [Acidobacteriota bacterium]|nr:MAG: transglycosylase SLT domain-containing protein [Acidobacteriota bacterium]
MTSELRLVFIGLISTRSGCDQALRGPSGPYKDLTAAAAKSSRSAPRPLPRPGALRFGRRRCAFYSPRLVSRTTPNRRDVLGMGLSGGVLALLSGAASLSAEDRTPYVRSEIHAAHPLEFRLDGEYVPDLSPRAAQRLQRAVLEFLYQEHTPRRMTMSFWDQNPRDLPFLDKHLRFVIEHLFAGIKQQLGIRPVDPILVLSLLYNESRFHPKVISPAGAVGIAQFMPETAQLYGLSPVARLDLWSEYRRLEEEHRRERAAKRAEFRRVNKIPSLRVEKLIDEALRRQDLALLAAYRALPDSPDAALAARSLYVESLREQFDRHHFFWSGRKPLGRIDGRISYDAVNKAVEYVARSLARHQGMASTAAAPYNAGPGAVSEENPRSILRRFGIVPSYDETVRYVQRFLAVYSAIKYRLYRLSVPPP